MRSHISAELRRLVAVRAGNSCEYCLIREGDTYFGCEVDHLISVKHGGVTVEGNLAYTCRLCNRRKGSDIASIKWQTGELIRFFDPRTQLWEEHFQLEGALILPLTDSGEVTVRIFGLNAEERIRERDMLISLGDYP